LEQEVTYQPEQLKVEMPKDMANGVGRVRGVKLLGWKSRNNNRTYLKEGVKAELYENVPVNINHPTEEEKKLPRPYNSRFGWIENPRVQPDGVFGDLCFNPNHEIVPSFLWWANNKPDKIGLSQNAYGDVWESATDEVVQSVDEVRSMDLVSDPASTNGLFEGFYPKEPERKTTKADQQAQHNQQLFAEADEAKALAMEQRAIAQGKRIRAGVRKEVHGDVAEGDRPNKPKEVKLKEGDDSEIPDEDWEAAARQRLAKSGIVVDKKHRPVKVPPVEFPKKVGSGRGREVTRAPKGEDDLPEGESQTVPNAKLSKEAVAQQIAQANAQLKKQPVNPANDMKEPPKMKMKAMPDLTDGTACMEAENVYMPFSEVPIGHTFGYGGEVHTKISDTHAKKMGTGKQVAAKPDTPVMDVRPPEKKLKEGESMGGVTTKDNATGMQDKKIGVDDAAGPLSRADLFEEEEEEQLPPEAGNPPVDGPPIGAPDDGMPPPEETSTPGDGGSMDGGENVGGLDLSAETMSALEKVLGAKLPVKETVKRVVAILKAHLMEMTEGVKSGDLPAAKKALREGLAGLLLHGFRPVHVLLGKLDENEVKERIDAKKGTVKKLLKVARLPKVLVTDHFLEGLMRCNSEREIQNAIDDRRSLVSAMGGKARSAGGDPLMIAGEPLMEGVMESTPKNKEEADKVTAERQSRFEADALGAM
jgi:hypothetical protein